MKNNFIVTTILLFIIAAGISSCCKYAKVSYKSCECKKYYAEVDNWFYYDKQLSKNFITEDKQIEDAISFLKKNADCMKDLNSKKLTKLFGGYPDIKNEKENKIVFRFFAHHIEANKKYKNPPINFTIIYNIGIEEAMYEKYDGGGGYFVHNFKYFTKN